MVNNYKRGSEWIKCDLHIHTPFSIEQQYGDGESDAVWEKFILDLEKLPPEYKIVGINDYLFIDGYAKVLEYKKEGRLANIDLILPVIELRVDKFGSVSAEDPLSRLNFHIIFSDELSPELIKAQFLDGLNSEYKVFPDYTGSESDWGGIITRDNLIQLGDKIKASSTVTISASSIKVGFYSLNISYDNLLEKLKNPNLKDKFLTAVGKTEWEDIRWTGSIAEKKSVINKADFVFTSSENEEAYYNAKEKLKAQGVNDLLLDCSDAHSFSDLTSVKDRIGNSLTWVKINPTFKGLRYLLYEPNERIFIGNLPDVEQRVRQNKNRYISKLEVTQIDGYNESQGIWFKDQEVELSKELTAIIGNKGKGKSAVTDIIGLAGNSHNQGYFSFIHKDKFKKGGLARNFEASLRWESGSIDNVNLGDPADLNNEEKVKYLPQSYFEDLCNEIDNNENFKREINQVVFKHIDITDRLGKNTFEDFIDEKKKNADSSIKVLRDSLANINSELITLQEKNTDEYLSKLKSKIKNKEEDLKSHLTSKPVNPIPEDDRKEDDEKGESGENYKKLKTAEKELQGLKEKEAEYITQLEMLNNQLLDLNQLRHRLESESERISSFRLSEEKSLEEYGITIEEVYPPSKINLVPIDKVVSEKEKSKSIIEIQLGRTAYSEEDHADLVKPDASILILQIGAKQKEYNEISKSLDATQKMKESYVTELAEWKKQKMEIEGSDESPSFGTLKYLINESKYIQETLPNQINEVKGKRNKISEDIYEEKEKIVSIYTNLKTNIDQKLKENADKIKEYQITLNASFQIKNFVDNFLDYIDKNRTGYFYGNEDAIKKIKDLLEQVEPNDKVSVISFLEDLTQKMEFKDGQKLNPFSQIKGSKDLTHLYNYLFGLEYLDEKYELRFTEKSIEQLSPGERGAALIVFYLLLDNDDKPLVIDQPEDNLDNQSVFQILVPFIKQAKKHRQLIIVTHNPNLAVVADAEQIIHVNIDKEDNNRFSVESGGIEYKSINQEIVRILEGTQRAFDNRKMKYLTSK